MTRRHRTAIIAAMCAALVTIGMVSAQNYSLDWWTVDGGGAMRTTGGDFELSGTIGQQDAGATLTGADFELNGGFWFHSARPQKPSLDESKDDTGEEVDPSRVRPKSLP